MTDAPSPETATDWARPAYEQQIALLGRMAEAGVEMALILERQAKATEAAGKTNHGNVFLDFARISRAVRLSLMLQSKLIRQLQSYDAMAETAAQCDAFEAEIERDARVLDRKARVEGIVEGVAERRGDRPSEVERLVEETAERLDRDDIYGDILTRPLSELVAMICKDLGLDPDWPRLAEEAWAKVEMAGGDVGWPLASLRSQMAPPSSLLPLREKET